jgi:hypothetical protein
MTARRVIVVVALGLATLFGTGLSASGRIGFYGIVEKVVFEPSEAAPERIQVWGAFMYVDGGASQNFAVSAPKRGYLYFKLKSSYEGYTSPDQMDLTKKEWKDLKAVAGTGQAVGFGRYGYIGSFGVLEPGGVAAPPSYLYENRPSGGDQADLRVRPANEAPSRPATYQTETGVVKLSDAGSHASVVTRLRDALKR